MSSSITELGHFDVIICGYGPTGAVLAAQLGKCGISVLIIESSDTLLDWPRAVHIDDQVMLILRSLNIPRSQLDACTYPMTHLTFRDHQQNELLRFNTRLSELSPDLNSDYLFHQPSLERAIRSQVDQHQSVKAIHGARVSLVQHDVTGIMISTECGLSASASYLLGCDGARSITRTFMNIPLLSFPSTEIKQSDQWLVIDGLMTPHDKHRAGLSELGVTQFCSPDQPMTIVSLADDMIRVELMLRDENVEEPSSRWSSVINQFDELFRHIMFILWHLIAPFILSTWSMAGEAQPEESKMSYSSTTQSDLHSYIKVAQSLLPSWFPCEALRITRASRYRTRGLLAQTCSSADQRNFLVGDSMHQSPPFLGQGGCLGIRDAANLSWKIAFAIRRQAQRHHHGYDPLINGLLSTYEIERRDEAHELISRALKVGQIISWPAGITCSLNHWCMINVLNPISAFKKRFSALPASLCAFGRVSRAIRWTEIDTFMSSRDRMLVVGLGVDPIEANYVDTHPMMSTDDCEFIRLERASLRDWLHAEKLPKHIDMIVFRPDGFIFAMYSSREVRWIDRSFDVHYSSTPFPLMCHLCDTLEQLVGQSSRNEQ